jgi:acyl carrier protein
MDQKQFLNNVETIVEANPGSLNFDQRLDSLAGWDSLATLSFLAMADAKYSVKVAAADLMNCRTVADLLKLVDKH